MRLIPIQVTGPDLSRCGRHYRVRCSNMRSTQRPDGSLEEIPPERCPAGHPLLPHGTLVGWSPCDCTPGVHGYRTYTCRYSVNGAECGLVLNFPPCRDPSAGPVVVGLINLDRIVPPG